MNTAIKADAKFSINIPRSKKKFCLSLHNKRKKKFVCKWWKSLSI